MFCFYRMCVEFQIVWYKCVKFQIWSYMLDLCKFFCIFEYWGKCNDDFCLWQYVVDYIFDEVCLFLQFSKYFKFGEEVEEQELFLEVVSFLFKEIRGGILKSVGLLISNKLLFFRIFIWSRGILVFFYKIGVYFVS